MLKKSNIFVFMVFFEKPLKLLQMRTKYFWLGKLELLLRTVPSCVFVCLSSVPFYSLKDKNVVFLMFITYWRWSIHQVWNFDVAHIFSCLGKDPLKEKSLLNLGEGAVDWKRLYLYCQCFQGPKMFVLRQNDCLNLSLWKSKKSEHKSVLKYSYYQIWICLKMNSPVQTDTTEN